MSQLPDLVQALLDPRAYPEKPAAVELIQTQISYVFVAGEFVYKVKKPVDFGFLDYSTLDKRRALCEKEVQLNQRLCPDAYLGVVPVTGDGGRFVIGGTGDIEEYAVKMRVLPRDAMMDVLLPQGRVTEEMIRRVAARLADFHAHAATGGVIDEIGGIDSVIHNVEENFTQTEKHIGDLVSVEMFDRITSFARDFYTNKADLFHRRVAEHHVRDCHGDLHAAHVCFSDGICIYDCIEFSDRLRYIDTAADIAFLAMDLDRYERRDLSGLFIDAYVASSGDTGLLELLNFYKCYRACVRFKVNCFQYDDEFIPAAEKERIARTASGYAELAASYTV